MRDYHAESEAYVAGWQWMPRSVTRRWAAILFDFPELPLGWSGPCYAPATDRGCGESSEDGGIFRYANGDWKPLRINGRFTPNFLNRRR